MRIGVADAEGELNMRGLSIACGMVLALAGGAAFAEPVAAPVAIAAAAYSSTTTPMGVLLANPATKAVLVKELPEFMAKLGDNVERVTGMTLKEVQEALKAYAPDALLDAKLAVIDQDLAKIPVAN
jgi:hypothetical protein